MDFLAKKELKKVPIFDLWNKNYLYQGYRLQKIRIHMKILAIEFRSYFAFFSKLLQLISFFFLFQVSECLVFVLKVWPVFKISCMHETNFGRKSSPLAAQSLKQKRFSQLNAFLILNEAKNGMSGVNFSTFLSDVGREFYLSLFKFIIWSW